MKGAHDFGVYGVLLVKLKNYLLCRKDRGGGAVLGVHVKRTQGKAEIGHSGISLYLCPWYFLDNIMEMSLPSTTPSITM
jgi:hypothetical protein